jgi:hypothetical protein
MKKKICSFVIKVYGFALIMCIEHVQIAALLSAHCLVFYVHICLSRRFYMLKCGIFDWISVYVTQHSIRQIALSAINNYLSLVFLQRVSTLQKSIIREIHMGIQVQ